MKLNREKTAAALALLIFISLGAYPLVGTLLGPKTQRAEIATRLNQSDEELSQKEPRLHLDDLGGSRNPFYFSSDWQAVAPEPLGPPALEPERRPRVLFGWPAEGRPSAVVIYQAAPPAEVREEGPSAQPGPADPGSGSTGGSP